jgi:deoxyribodipyrimidine photolyase-related protein
MMTRPYFSSSNYINKMSTYKVSVTDSWSKIWNALYYNFIDVHEKIFRKNYAIAQQVKHWDNKTDEEKKTIKKIASKYISDIFN